MKKLFLFFAALCCTFTLMAQSYLPDGALISIGGSYLEENIIRAGDVPELIQGTMTYDPENHVLTLTDVIIETSTALTALGFNATNMAEGSVVEVRIVGSNTIKNTQPTNYALAFGDGKYILTGLNGVLKLMSKDGTGLAIGCQELTIKDGITVQAGYSESGIETSMGTSIMLMADPPVVTIQCAKLESYGSDACMVGINPGLINAVEQDGYTYNSVKDYWTEDGTNILKGKWLTFNPTKHVFTWINASPEGGTITVTDNGNPLSNPYYYGTDEENKWIDILATPNEGWEFVSWKTCGLGAVWSGTAEDKYGLPELSQTGMLIGNFRKTNPEPPSKPWYMLHNTNNEVVEYTDLTQDPQTVATAIPNKTNITQSTFAEGKLYYLDQLTSSEVAFFSTAFDPSTGISTSRDAVFASQTTYQKFYALTYNPVDRYFYATAKKNDSKQYLLKISLTGSIFVVGEIKNADMNNSVGVYLLAANRQGELYGIFKSAETYDKEKSPFRHGSMLCKISTTTAAITPIGWTGLYFESYSCAMSFDYKTNALIGTNDTGNDKCIFSIDTQTGHATRLAEFVAYNNGIFQLLPETRSVSVGVKSGDEDKGTAVLLESGKTEGRVMIGEEFDIEAFPKTEEYRFVKWSDGNTDNPRTISFDGAEASYTYTAEFDWAEGVTPYPIWVGRKQITSHSGVLQPSTYDPITSGTAVYTSATHTLLLRDMNLQYYQEEPAIAVVGEDASHREKVTITLEGNCQIDATPTSLGLFHFKNADVTITGSGNMDASVLSTLMPCVVLDNASLTIEATTMKLQGNNGSLVGGEDNTTLTIRGSNVDFNQSVKVGDLQLPYCDITSPSGAAFNPATHQIEKDGSLVETGIKVTAWPTLRVQAAEDGTAEFTLKCGTTEFVNIGWFQKDDEVTITPKPLSGYEFGFWTDDPKWNDEDAEQRIAAERKFTKTAGTDELSARFFYIPKSTATWYGVNNGKFVSFSFADHGLEVAKASLPNATNVKAGDYTPSGWVYQDGSTVRLKAFSDIEDGEEMEGDVTDLGTSATSATDIAFNFNDNATYAVDGSKLYRVDDEGKFEEVGVFEFDEAPVTGVKCIAIDGKGDIYVLKVGADPILYTVNEMDEDGKKVKLDVVGEDGKLGVSVSDESQSLAFDHVTGELFLGANDFLRLVSTQNAKTNIVASLGWDKTAQKTIKAMHRKTQKITVRVYIAGEHDTWGTATVNNKSSVSVIETTKVTLKATPAQGYEFKYWTQGNEDGEEVSKEATLEVVAKGSASKNKYYAHFKKQEQGIDEVESTKTPIYKIVKDGRLYIIRNGEMYNAQGARVE